MAECLPRVYADPSDDEARGRMLLAASYAGIGFGNAGVHLPHAMAYPVAGQVEKLPCRPGYSTDHAMVPHGTSVIVHTPAVCRLTAPAAPERHLQAAAALGADVRAVPLSKRRRRARRPRAPLHADHRSADGDRGLRLHGGGHPRLVEGTLVQARLLKLSPIDPTAAVLAELFRSSLQLA